MMKTKLLSLIFLTLIGLTIVSCSNEDDTTILSVETPTNVEVNERLVSWDLVNNATEYVVKLDDQTYNVETNEFNIPLSVSGSVSVQVKAKNDDAESEYSEAITINLTRKLEAPSNLDYVDNQIVWDAVSGANGYIVNINGAEFFTENTYYPYEIEDGATIKVLAVGSTSEGIESSDYTDILDLTVPLNAPENIVLTEGTLTWDEVENATGYILVIGTGSDIETTTNSYDVGYDYAGTYTVKVKATDDTGGYSDSSFTSQEIVFPTLTLEVPSNIEINNDELTFDSVDLAESYEIYVKGELLTTITSTTYTIPSSVMNDSSAYIEVRAISDIHNPSSLSIKVFVNLTEIANETDLRNMSSTGNYILTANISLTSDWVPIDFTGNFDGDGYTISNVNITNDDIALGFFRNVHMAIIKDLTIIGDIEVTTNSYQAEIGGLAGRITYSDVQNVDIDFSILASSLNGVGNLGGVFGRIQNTDINEVSFNGTIDAENFTTGGFAGRADNPEVLSEVSYVDVTADIVVTGGEQSFSGGFIGFLANNSLTISRSSVDVDLLGTVYVGGFIGYFGSGHINNAYSMGIVEAVNENLAHVGGFVGRLEGYNSTMVNCIAQVDVIEHTEGDMIYIGGFTGYTLGGSFAQIYDNCYYDDLENDMDRIGNPTTGRGDGITSISISEISTISGFDESIWDFSGVQPSFTWN